MIRKHYDMLKTLTQEREQKTKTLLEKNYDVPFEDECNKFKTVILSFAIIAF